MAVSIDLKSAVDGLFSSFLARDIVSKVFPGAVASFLIATLSPHLYPELSSLLSSKPHTWADFFLHVMLVWVLGFSIQEIAFRTYWARFFPERPGFYINLSGRDDGIESVNTLHDKLSELGRNGVAGRTRIPESLPPLIKYQVWQFLIGEYYNKSKERSAQSALNFERTVVIKETFGNLSFVFFACFVFIAYDLAHSVASMSGEGLDARWRFTNAAQDTQSQISEILYCVAAASFALLLRAIHVRHCRAQAVSLLHDYQLTLEKSPPESDNHAEVN